MKKNNLIKQDIDIKKNHSVTKNINQAPPILGKKIYSIKVDAQKYRKANSIVISILTFALILSLVNFIITFNHWLVVSIAFTTILCFIIWAILAVKKSLIKVEYVLYENYVIKAYEDWYACVDISKFIGYKIKSTFTDKIFKPVTKTLILYFNDKEISHLKLNCINDDLDKIINLILKYSKK